MLVPNQAGFCYTITTVEERLACIALSSDLLKPPGQAECNGLSLPTLGGRRGSDSGWRERRWSDDNRRRNSAAGKNRFDSSERRSGGKRTRSGYGLNSRSEQARSDALYTHVHVEHFLFYRRVVLTSHIYIASLLIH